jgi:hypothetical protein
MMVQYSYVTWSPPSLTESQELELGRQIALVGREHFVREFRKSIGKSQQPRKGGIADWPPAARWAFIVVFGGFILFGLAQMDESAWRGLVALLVMVLGIYFVSVYFATRKFERWIDRLVARYAAHVARGGT